MWYTCTAKRKQHQTSVEKQAKIDGIKAKYYDEEKKDAHLARLIRCFAPMMTGGIDRQSLDTQEALHEGETAVEKLKRRLRWRDEATEAQWTTASIPSTAAATSCAAADASSSSSAAAVPHAGHILRTSLRRAPAV